MLYDRLVEFDDSQVVALNRAVLGEFESRLHLAPAAAAHFRKSLQLAGIKSEQMFLAKRVQDCEEIVPVHS